MGNKRQPFNSTVEASVSQFWEDLDGIIDDLDGTLSGMEEKMSGTSRYQAYEDAKQELENFQGDAPDIPDFLSDIKLVYYNDTRARESRTYAVRRDNMCAMLDAATSIIKGQLEDHGDEFTEEQRTEAKELVEKLEEMHDEVMGISFE